MYNFEEINNKLQKELTKKRYTHTLGVSYTAAALAMKYGYDIKKAQVAGLLHDCAKCNTDEKMLEKCKKNKIKMTDVEKKNPYLLHAKLGACLAKKQYGIEEEEILSAITYHTTGKPAMSELEKIVFISDYIEPNRKEIWGLPQIRKIAFENLDEAVFLILEHTLSYLKKENVNKEIDSMTEEAFEYYKRERIRE